jgi:hypothetical protein
MVTYDPEPSVRKGRDYTLRETLTILYGSLQEFGERLRDVVKRGRKLAPDVRLVKGLEDFELEELGEFLSSATQPGIRAVEMKREHLEKILRNLVDRMCDFRDRMDRLESAIVVLEREILKRELEEVDRV